MPRPTLVIKIADDPSSRRILDVQHHTTRFHMTHLYHQIVVLVWIIMSDWQLPEAKSHQKKQLS